MSSRKSVVSAIICPPSKNEGQKFRTSKGSEGKALNFRQFDGNPIAYEADNMRHTRETRPIKNNDRSRQESQFIGRRQNDYS